MADTDLEDYIARTARELGIELGGEDAQRAKMVFANLERLAKMLDDAPLTDEDIAAPVFRPGACRPPSNPRYRSPPPCAQATPAPSR